MWMVPKGRPGVRLLIIQIGNAKQTELCRVGAYPLIETLGANYITEMRLSQGCDSSYGGTNGALHSASCYIF